MVRRRVRTRIPWASRGAGTCATMASVKEGYGNLMLTPELQAEFIAERPDLFLPIHGGWGRMGMTHIRLAVADKDSLRGALHSAWKLRTDKNGKSAGQRTRKSTKR